MIIKSARWTVALMGLTLAGGLMAEELKKDTVKKEEPKTDAKAADAKESAKMGPKKVLAEFDTNGDGKITGAEAEALRKAFAGPRHAKLERYDKDGNGKLDDSEIAAIKTKKSAQKAATPTPAPAPTVKETKK